MKRTPETPLAKVLADAAALKREMLELLIELETQATGKAPARPGIWRHHPAQWVTDNPPR